MKKVNYLITLDDGSIALGKLDLQKLNKWISFYNYSADAEEFLKFEQDFRRLIYLRRRFNPRPKAMIMEIGASGWGLQVRHARTQDGQDVYELSLADILGGILGGSTDSTGPR